MEFEPFYTTREAAEMLGVTLQTVNEWIRKGKIHAITINHRCRIILVKDLDEFIKDRLSKKEEKKEEQHKKRLDYQREYYKRNHERLLKKHNEWNAKNSERRRKLKEAK